MGMFFFSPTEGLENGCISITRYTLPPEMIGVRGWRKEDGLYFTVYLLAYMQYGIMSRSL